MGDVMHTFSGIKAVEEIQDKSIFVCAYIFSSLYVAFFCNGHHGLVSVQFLIVANCSV